jgi:hypothetical protein
MVSIFTANLKGLESIPKTSRMLNIGLSQVMNCVQDNWGVKILCRTQHRNISFVMKRNGCKVKIM